MQRTILPRLQGCLRDERGQVAILFGLALIPLMAGLGLIVEGGLLLFEDRRVQNAADAGGYAGTRVLYKLVVDTNGDGTPDAPLDSSSIATQVAGLCSAVQGTGRPAVDAACSAAISRGYTADEVTVNMPPLISAAFAGAAGHIEVRVGRVLGTSIMSLVGVSQVTAGGRAVGGGFPGSALYAIYALSQTACPGLDIASQGSLTVVGGVKVNAECRPPVASEYSTDKSGGGDVTITGPFDIVGDYSQSGGGSVAPQPTEDTGVLPDPFGALLSPVTCLQGAGLGPCSDTRLRFPLVVADTRFTAHYDIQVGWECAPTGDPPPCDPLAGETKVPKIQHYGVHANNQLLTVNGSPTNPQTYNACNGPDHDGDGKPELYPGVYFGGIQTSGNGCNNGLQVKGGAFVVAGRSGPGRSVDFSKTLIPSFLPVNNINISDPFGNYVRSIVGVDGNFFYLTKAPCDPARCQHGSFNLSTSGAGQTAVLDAGPPTGPPDCIPGVGSYKGILAWQDRANPGDYDSVAAPLCDSVSASCDNQFFVQGGGTLTKLIGSLYDRYGRLRANGSYQFEDAQLIFNVVDLEIQGDVTVSAPNCSGGQPLQPRLRE